MTKYKTFYEWLWDKSHISKSVYQYPHGVEGKSKDDIEDFDIITYAEYAKEKNEFLKAQLEQELKVVEKDLLDANKILKDHEEKIHKRVDAYFKKMGVRRNR